MKEVTKTLRVLVHHVQILLTVVHIVMKENVSSAQMKINLLTKMENVSQHVLVSSLQIP